MTDGITTMQFHEAEGTEDWGVAGEGACTGFLPGSLEAGLGQAIGGPEDLEPHPDVDALDVWVPHDQAEGRVEAISAGARLVSDDAPAWWTLADAEGNEVDVATTRGRD